jgi:hypothetical protein
MASTLIIGDYHATAPWGSALRAAGHDVEHCGHALAFQDRFTGPPPDVLIVEVTNADQGEAMLMVQAPTVWPRVRVIALPRDKSYRSSALYRMGLWAPHRMLMQPVDDALLVQCVGQLWNQSRAQGIVRRRRGIGRMGNVITPAHWAAKPH